MIRELVVKKKIGKYQVLFIKNNNTQDVIVEEVKEIDCGELKKRLQRGDSIFITSKYERDVNNFSYDHKT